MSATELQFRTSAFGGFHKQDVLSYIEASGREHAAQLEAVQKELETAQKELEEARKANAALEEAASSAAGREGKLSGQVGQLTEALEERTAALADARAELERRERRITGLETELAGVRERLNRAEPGAEAYERIKNRTAGVELEAHRRAQEIEDEAREKARQARAELEQWIYKVQAGYDQLRTDVDATISHAAGELERVRRSLDGLMGQFDEGDQALAALLHTYQSAVGPKAPEPLPLKED